ncbi:MAG TPA: hypothetical protein VFM94_00195 [Solirubrobacterales bacterium]|nr:hypothetical protein [Solirubrobacterales bacterium]
MKVVRCVLAVLASCGALLALAAPAALGRGHLDVAFGDDGVVDLRVRAGNGPFVSLGVVRVGPEGGIFLTEESDVCQRSDCSYRIYLRRYRPGGRLDRGFGGGRRVGAGVTDTNADLAVDSAGRPLVALQEEDGVVIKRFRPNGRPDRPFGKSGSVFVPCDCSLGSLKVGPGDRPLLVASAEFKQASPFRGVIWVMARLRSNGSPDRGFGGDGIVRHPMPGFYAPLAEVEPSGGALLHGSVCCRFPSKPFVQRMSKRGHLQRKYGAATKRALHGLYGTREEDVGWDESAVVLRPDGRVEVFGGDYPHSVAVRLLRNGKRDPGFGRRGVRMLRFLVSDAIADERGGTLVTGYASGRRGGYKVMRLRRDGRSDRGFGRVDLPHASNEEGLEIFSQGPRAALVFDRGIPFCRQGCAAEPKLFRVVDPAG